MSGTLSPVPWLYFADTDGAPASGWKLYTYESGTDTPAPTYTTSALSSLAQNTNPIILDSAGRTPYPVYLAAASYKYRLYDENDVFVRETDPVSSTGLSSSIIGSLSYFLGGDPNSPITATSYPSGTTFDTCLAGSAWILIDSANLVGTFALEGMMLGVGGVTVTAALVNLTDGSPDTPIITIASTSTTGERQRSAAITFASGGSSKTYALKGKVSSGSGEVWDCSLVRLS